MSDDSQAAPATFGPVAQALKRQYKAGLAMLRQAVELCPEQTWAGSEHVNAPWQLAYHALFFTHLYLAPAETDFRPWPKHVGEVQHPDGIAGPRDPSSQLPIIPEPYSRDDVLEYVDYVSERVDTMVDAIDLGSAESGFDWYPISKVEHQIVNVRHLQHHTAQLMDRVREAAGVGVDWVGSRA